MRIGGRNDNITNHYKLPPLRGVQGRKSGFK